MDGATVDAAATALAAEESAALSADAHFEELPVEVELDQIRGGAR